MKFDIYKAITERIISQLERGIIPWRKPWSGTPNGPISYATGKPYSLLNQMLLGKAGEYLTYNQIQEAGGRVKKGSKAKMVVFWKTYNKTNDSPEDDSENNGENKKTVMLLRYYNVFHIDDCEGVEAKHKMVLKPNNPIQTAEDIISNYLNREKGLKFETVISNKACYNTALDKVSLPKIEQFNRAEEYYSTVFHELIHSTGHVNRCNREDFKGNIFGDEKYSKEELVAEIGAAALTNIAGIESNSSFKNSAAYINSWIEGLKNDKRLIVTASSKADKAVCYILGTETETKRKTA